MKRTVRLLRLTGLACLLLVVTFVAYQIVAVMWLVADIYSRKTTFEVLAPEASGAEIFFCGKPVTLSRSGEGFSAVLRIPCEGTAEIAVYFPDRPPVICGIGYVTGGMGGEYRFKVDGDSCEGNVTSPSAVGQESA